MFQRPLSLAGLALLLAVCLFPKQAHAIHKSWLLKNSGLQCAFTTPNPELDNYFGAQLSNGSNSNRSVICPVSLAGRWGSSSPVVSAPLWAAAYAATIYLNNNKPGATMSCTVRARMGSGGIRYSRTVSTTGTGPQRLSPATNSSWGGNLDTYEAETLRSMDFDCSLPGNYSTVYGYRVRICQNLSGGQTCGDPARPDAETVFKPDSGGAEFVQTSGSECVTWNDSNLERTHTGAKNASTNWVSLYCPITPPSEDTNEKIRKVDTVAVYYKQTDASMTPTCQMTWTDRWPTPGAVTTQEFWSTAFPLASFPTRLERTMDVDVRLDVGMAVYCDVPPGTTIQGITSRIEVAPVSEGG